MSMLRDAGLRTVAMFEQRHLSVRGRWRRVYLWLRDWLCRWTLSVRM